MEQSVLATVFGFWIKAFLFTLAVELPIFVLLVRGKVPLWRAALAGAAGTCVTHPCLWFVWPHVVQDYTTYIVSGELLVATLESLSFFGLARPVRLPRAVAASFLANGASYGLGALLRLAGLLG